MKLHNQTRTPHHIIITGASSGIGAALARAYAAPGIRLGLTGRNTSRLAETAESCHQRGARTVLANLDVRDQAAMKAWLMDQDSNQPVDLIIANAGISAGTGESGESEAQAREIFAVNLEGVLNTIHPLLPAMQARQSGQIALVSSLAGFRGFPGAPAYCASKAAVRLYGEALRGSLRRQQLGVSVICPGWVESAITQVNRFPMPFMWNADRAARHIRHKLTRNQARIAFPWPVKLAVWWLAALPPGWTDALLTKTPTKASTKTSAKA